MQKVLDSKGPDPPLRFPSNSVVDDLWLTNRKAAASVDQPLQVSYDSNAAVDLRQHRTWLIFCVFFSAVF